MNTAKVSECPGIESHGKRSASIGRVFVSSHWAMELFERETGRSDFPGMCRWLRNLGIFLVEAGTSHPARTVSTCCDAAATLASQGLEGTVFLVHNAFPLPNDDFVLNLASPNEGVRMASLNAASRSAKIAASCGAPFYSVHCGFLSDPSGRDSRQGFTFDGKGKVSMAEGVARFLDSLAKLRETAPDELRIIVENSPLTHEKSGHILLPDPADLSDAIAGAGIRNTGILLDLGHLQVTAGTMKVNPVEMLERTLPLAKCLHMSLNDGMDDLHLDPGMNPWFLSGLKTFISATIQSGGIDAMPPPVLEYRFENSTNLMKTVAFWNIFFD